MFWHRVYGRLVLFSFISSLGDYDYSFYETEDMTTSPTPTFKLDPKALAAAVPLRRVGTEEVRIKFFDHNCMGNFLI